MAQKFVHKFIDHLSTQYSQHNAKSFQNFLAENQRLVVSETEAISQHLVATEWARLVASFLERAHQCEVRSTTYRVLRNLASDSHDLRKQLADNDVPYLVGKDLAEMQSSYREREVHRIIIILV